MRREPLLSPAIRLAGPSDIAPLSALAKATYAATFGHSMRPAEFEWQLAHTRSEAYFRDRLAADTILVAVLADGIAGYVQIADVSLPIQAAGVHDQQLNALYVESRFQGRGIGRRLMAAVLQLPRLGPADYLYLDVWNENKRALQFYARQGFQVVGECDVVVDSHVVGKDLIMRRRLADQEPRTSVAADPSSPRRTERR
jgi:ribosomal protein S18 acetylase RimI-like enzyme